MTWCPPSFADTGATGPCRCPGCRRLVPAGMLYDLSALEASTPIPKGARYACDACRERLFREGHVTKAAYLAAVGAPPELVARHSIADPGLVS